MRTPWLELEQLIAADPVKGAYLSDRLLNGAGEPQFRMALWRIWDEALPLLAVVGANPSTADAERDDMTVTKLVGFGKRAGYGGFILGNLWAYRATDPMALLTFGTKNAVGPNNREWVTEIVRGRDTLVAWGICRNDLEHLLAMENLIQLHTKRIFCLGQTLDGYPRHPSRLGYDTPWEEWQPALRKIG